MLESIDDVLNQKDGHRDLVLASKETEAYLQNAEAASAGGAFRFPNLIITQAPGTLRVLKFVVSGLDPNGIPKSFVVRPPIQAALSRPCRAGEE